MNLSELKRMLKPWIWEIAPRWVYPFDDVWAGTSGQPLTSTSYDGNDTIAVGTVTLDTSAVFSVPAGVRAVNAYIRASWVAAVAASNLQIKLTGDSNIIAELKAHDTYAQDMTVIIPCDSNGDFDIVVINADAINVNIAILGYQL